MIKTGDIKIVCTCEEKAALKTMIDYFSKSMKEKLLLKLDAGYRGWDETENKESIEAYLKDHVKKGLQNKGNLVDIANFCAMLWNMDKPA